MILSTIYYYNRHESINVCIVYICMCMCVCVCVCVCVYVYILVTSNFPLQKFEITSLVV